MVHQETRDVSFEDLEIRSSTTDSQFIGQVAGYAIVFNKQGKTNGITEYIDPHALDGVDLSKVLALYNHDYGDVLGRANAGTLALKVDKIGLHFVLNIPDTTLGHDVYTNIRAGNLQGLSFGFRVAQGGDRVTRKNGNIVRTITKIEKLTEISIVAVPAYEDTKLEITRSAENKLKKDDDYKAKVGVVLPLYD